jgi:hypothetical protein
MLKAPSAGANVNPQSRSPDRRVATASLCDGRSVARILAIGVAVLAYIALRRQNPVPVIPQTVAAAPETTPSSTVADFGTSRRGDRSSGSRANRPAAADVHDTAGVNCAVDSGDATGKCVASGGVVLAEAGRKRTGASQETTGRGCVKYCREARRVRGGPFCRGDANRRTGGRARSADAKTRRSGRTAPAVLLRREDRRRRGRQEP